MENSYYTVTLFFPYVSSLKVFNYWVQVYNFRVSVYSEIYGVRCRVSCTVELFCKAHRYVLVLSCGKCSVVFCKVSWKRSAL